MPKYYQVSDCAAHSIVQGRMGQGVSESCPWQKIPMANSAQDRANAIACRLARFCSILHQSSMHAPPVMPSNWIITMLQQPCPPHIPDPKDLHMASEAANQSARSNAAKCPLPAAVHLSCSSSWGTVLQHALAACITTFALLPSQSVWLTSAWSEDLSVSCRMRHSTVYSWPTSATARSCFEVANTFIVF